MNLRFKLPAAGISAKPRLAISTLALSAIVFGLPNAGSAAVTQVPAAVPFASFVAGFERSKSTDFVGRPGNRVAAVSDFEDMRGLLVQLYAGIDVKESYFLNGQTFDCVRYDQQPAVRMQHLTSIAHQPPTNPSLAGVRVKGSNVGRNAVALDGRAVRSAVIDEVSCRSGTFPLPRVTLEQLTKFGSLREFFSKGPGTSGRPQLAKPGTGGRHAYAYATQNVTNYGSYANESVYAPHLNTNLGEVFSLQQQWTIAYGTQGVQTAEVGWQIFPGLYGTSQPVLFAYYTGDNYKYTGCYNYTCGAFVQNSGSTIHLQTTLSPVSAVRGAQYQIADGYWLYAGNWWLAVQGQWVGYYPGSLYSVGGTGGLMSASTVWQVGTESDPGPYWWPSEGSGKWGYQGYGYASWFNNLLYRDSGNGGHVPSFTSENPSPNCYNITNETYGGSSWNYYLFVGGPGGSSC